MKAIVVIPFRGSAEILNWVLDGFAQQQLPADLTVEVRVGGDGCVPPSPPVQTTRGVSITTRELPHVGNSIAKNMLMENTDADVVIFGNADTRPEPDFIARHVARLISLPTGSMVLGAAPYEKSAHPTIFEAFAERTPALFFYCQMKPGQWYDYRFAWTLSLSMLVSDFRRVGGFSPKLYPCYYEDLVLGYRLLGTSRKGVFYDPAIRVTHRHPMNFDHYLMREELMGLIAPLLYDAAPEIAANLFGSGDPHALAAQYDTWVHMDAPMHQWIYRRTSHWLQKPERELESHPESQALLDAIYQMHIPLKRLAFRLGFLRGLTITNPQDRQPTGLWQAVIQNGVVP